MLTTLASALVLAAEEGTAEEGEGIDLLIPETSELIAGIIAFAIIFFFVWKWVLPAVNRTLEARREAITGQVTEAEKTRAEAESLLEDYRKQLAGARSEANKIVDDAKESAETVRADIVAKAEAEAAERRRKADEEIAAERDRLEGALRSEVRDFSLSLAQEAVRKSVDEDVHRALIDSTLDEIDGLSLNDEEQD